MRVEGGYHNRIDERRPFQGVVQVSWQTRSGETVSIRAKCTDISNQGARIECAQPIDWRTNVYLQAPAYGLMGNATVRYCRRSGTKHIIGLLFSSPASQADQGRKILIQRPPGAEKPDAN
jgi:hypothetical protein